MKTVQRFFQNLVSQRFVSLCKEIELIGNRFSTKSFNQRATESIPLQESKIPSDENSNKKLRNSLIFFGCVSMGLLSYDGWFAYCNRKLLFNDPVLDITIWKQFGPDVYNLALQMPEVQSRYGTKNKFHAQQLRVVEKNTNLKFFTYSWNGGFYQWKFRIFEYIGEVLISMPLRVEGSPTLNIVARTNDGRWSLERAYFEEPNNLCIKIPVSKILSQNSTRLK